MFSHKHSTAADMRKYCRRRRKYLDGFLTALLVAKDEVDPVVQVLAHVIALQRRAALRHEVVRVLRLSAMLRRQRPLQS
jgi:hypothetical protein